MPTPRLLAVLAAVALVLTACGEGDPTVPAPEGTEGGDLPLNEEGVLTVGSDLAFAPFEFIEEGEERGFDIDVMDAIAAELGLDTTYVDADFQGILAQLATGEFDVVVSAVTITEDRAETVDFSEPYFEAVQALVVAEGSDIESEADLAGASVGAQAGTTGLKYANENFTESEIFEYPEYPAAFTALEAGELDAVIADLPAADEAASGSEQLVIATEIDTDEQYGIAVDPEKPELLDAVNQALDTVIADGTYAEIFEKWFPEAEVPEQFRPEEG
jgi:polar amino acid transport system substrate-binding protein